MARISAHTMSASYAESFACSLVSSTVKLPRSPPPSRRRQTVPRSQPAPYTKTPHRSRSSTPVSLHSAAPPQLPHLAPSLRLFAPRAPPRTRRSSTRSSPTPPSPRRHQSPPSSPRDTPRYRYHHQTQTLNSSFAHLLARARARPRRKAIDTPPSPSVRSSASA